MSCVTTWDHFIISLSTFADKYLVAMEQNIVYVLLLVVLVVSSANGGPAISANGEGPSADLKDAVENALREISSLQRQHHVQQEELRKMREELAAVSSRVVPVGSIYIEYHGQPNPPSLWPDLTWKDITSTYAGLFFRAEGGGAAADWGTTQEDCSPRLTQMEHSWRNTVHYPNVINLPSSGWSEYGAAAVSYWAESPVWYESVRFHTESCEVRPRNQAIRIWKRTA